MKTATEEFSQIIQSPQKGTRFILIRHGETDWNREKRFQGHTDIPLNANGLAQARRVAEFFGQGIPSGSSLYSHCISSDLQRALVTAREIHGDRMPPPLLHAGLRERNYGHLSGLTAEEMELKSPAEYRGLRSRQVDAPLLGGESLHDFHQRVVSAFQGICRDFENTTVLLVAHGGVLDCIYRHCTGEPLEKPRSWQLPNCALNVVELDSTGRSRVLLWGWLKHLREDSNGQNLDEVDGRIA